MLPTCIEEIVFCFAFQQLTLDELLETMPNNDISDTTKKTFDKMIATTYKKAFGRTSDKYPLDFWHDIEQHIKHSCGLDMPREYPFMFIYVFLF